MATTNFTAGVLIESSWLNGIDGWVYTDTLPREEHVATSGQTAFTLTNSYTPGLKRLLVFVDGALCKLTDDYTETGANTVTFTYGLIANMEVTFIILEPQ